MIDLAQYDLNGLRGWWEQNSDKAFKAICAHHERGEYIEHLMAAWLCADLAFSKLQRKLQPDLQPDSLLLSK
jgi:hypothetical protein